jgi:hypothetical protein
MTFLMLLLVLSLQLAFVPIVLFPLLSSLLFSRLGMKRKKTRRLHLLKPCLLKKPLLENKQLLIQLQG